MSEFKASKLYLDLIFVPENDSKSATCISVKAGAVAQLFLPGFLGKIKLYLSKRPLPSPTDRKKFDQDFAISTSFHGIHNIAQNQNKLRKVIWLSVVLGSVSLLVWQIYSRLVNYFTWPTTTSIEVQYVEKIEFPAVTFCNLNRFQTEAVSRFGIIFFLWDIISKVLRLQEISANNTGPPETLDFVTNHQNFSITEFVKNNGFYLNHDTLVHCEFFGKTCGPKVMFEHFSKYSQNSRLLLCSVLCSNKTNPLRNQPKFM